MKGWSPFAGSGKNALTFICLGCMIAAIMPTRREFLFGAAAGVAVTMLGCRKDREAVLKIPEDAEECFDLFKFFTEPNFDFEQAKNGLGITGTPKVLQSS